MKEINATYTKKNTCWVNRNKFVYFNTRCKIQDGKIVRDTKFTHFCLDIITSGLYRKIGAKIMEIKVAEINAPLK